MLTVFCPPNEMGIFETQGVVNGNQTKLTYAPRWFNGRLVIDVPRKFFVSQILQSKHGKKWEDENPEAMAWLGQNDHVMEVNDAFPGANRPPPVAPVATEVAPVMVRLRAPPGVSSFSHAGTEHKIDKSGHVTVDEHVAAVLRSHSFVRA